MINYYPLIAMVMVKAANLLPVVLQPMPAVSFVGHSFISGGVMVWHAESLMNAVMVAVK